MRAVGDGDHAAFTRLVDTHLDHLYAYALRLSRSASLAEDLVQEAWLTLWQKPQQFKPGRARLTTWLHRIVHNRFIDSHRRRHEIPEPEANALVPQTRNLEDTVLSAARLTVLDEALKQLPDTQRSALLLAQVQGFSTAEVARIIGASPRATESLIARARRSLRAALEADDAGAGLGADTAADSHPHDKDSHGA